MPAPKFLSLDDLDSQAATDPVDVSAFETFSVLCGGTFVGTYSVQVSNDGTTWINHPTATGKTAPFVLDISANGYKQLRVNCSAYTSGTIVSIVGGRDSDLKG